ncbi:IS3 family transposase [Arthrobacter woluwensis]|uniref:Putative transposase n=1 Tax=Arthrobacter woluwensis TaxID=156980 RepID=A0A1H4N9S9_9MICC|nr:IS3 family transposase [Arthrobacter woluwensis]SEB92051.1 putative transposase [Arthrobacter woluwensis]
MKALAVSSLKAEHPLPALLEAAGLARSTYFYHQARMSRPDPQAQLKDAAREAFAQARGRYGHRRIHTMLARQGWVVAKKTVLALMRKLRLVCKVRRRRLYNSYKGRMGKVAPNVLKRDFNASAPGQKLVTDVTEFHLPDGRLYLSPVIDLFDRPVVAFTMGPSPTLDLANGSLRAALKTLPRDQSPIVHSDQGTNYQHRSWGKLLVKAGATQSMSRKGNCLDNAVAENFFGPLKSEMFHGEKFTIRDELAGEIREYINWYNHERISTTLKGLSPAQYRAQALQGSCEGFLCDGFASFVITAGKLPGSWWRVV